MPAKTRLVPFVTRITGKSDGGARPVNSRNPKETGSIVFRAKWVLLDLL